SRRPRRRRSAYSSRGNRGSMLILPSGSLRLLEPRLALRLIGLEVSEHGLPADRPLPNGCQGGSPRRQIDIDARTKADQSEPLPYSDAVAFGKEGDDAPRDQPCNLHDPNFGTAGRADDEGAPLVFLARLVEGGIEEAARDIDRARDATRNRRTVDVNIKEGQEN